MRYVSSSLVLAVLVFVGAEVRANPDTSQAAASPEAIEAPRARVVAIMKDAGQALLWDGNRDEYVVVRVGGSFQTYQVTAIAPEHVVLTRRPGNQHFVLPRIAEPAEVKSPGGQGMGQTSGGARPSSMGGELMDPYALQSGSSPAMSRAPGGGATAGGELLDPYRDPYRTDGPIHTVTAPPGARASEPMPPTTPAAQPVPANSPTVAPAPPKAPDRATDKAQAPPAQATDRLVPEKAPVTPGHAQAEPVAASAPGKGTVSQERYSVSRREFDAVITDFHSLGKELQIALESQGVRIRDVAHGSLFYRLGLRPGDLVLSVDDQPIRGVDDAAAIYAQLMESKAFKVHVQRGVDTVVLSYRFAR